jgi:hypothetical protein
MLLLELIAQAIDVLALFWTASWFGLSSAKGNSAAIKALLLVQVLPSFLCCGFRLLTDLAFWSWAKAQLYRDFRALALKPIGDRSIP